MKKVNCYEFDAECCPTCHNEDNMFISYYKDHAITHCCNSIFCVKDELDKEIKDLEDNCE